MVVLTSMNALRYTTSTRASLDSVAADDLALQLAKKTHLHLQRRGIDQIVNFTSFLPTHKFQLHSAILPGRGVLLSQTDRLISVPKQTEANTEFGILSLPDASLPTKQSSKTD
jgi:hypothetical protein